ncbi:MAG: AmmeMemoRadiSam system radical SAM enzyme [Candidatus Aminicenantales bacterium]
MHRREFIKTAGAAGIALGAGWGSLLEEAYAFGEKSNLSQEEARFYEKLPDREIECTLCPRKCKLGDRERGYCGVRENVEGRYVTLVYGKACAIHIDPIEKKPLFHFLPGTMALSLATAGCNVNCKFCQNWEISQVRPEQVRHVDFPPERVASSALENACPVIAYTYTEPVVFYEYMFDTSVAARKKGVKNVVITGGHISADPLRDLIKVVDAIKVDLKAFNQDFYTQYVRGELQPVLDGIRLIAQTDVWLEIVYLVIPTLNDSPEEIRRMSGWLVENAGPEVPVHFSRFHPMYLMKNLPPTPVSTLERAHDVAVREGLKYVYIGNVPGHTYENTFCPECHQVIIRRTAYRIHEVKITNGRCSSCGARIPGIWE